MELPLLQLPEPALDVLVALLPSAARHSLRCCSTAALEAVDTRITQLTIRQRGPFRPLQHRLPCLAQLVLGDPYEQSEQGA